MHRTPILDSADAQMTQDACPDAPTLKAFLDGLTSEADAARIASHVESCTECLAVLESQDQRASLVDLFREAAGRPAAHERTELLRQRLASEAEPRAGDALDATPSLLESDVDTTVDRESLRSRRLIQRGVPARIGEYEILEEVGAGGMGVVYLARHVRLDREVALKTVREAALSSPEALKRFQVEARAVAQLDHPGIVPLFEAGEHDGFPYFAMAFVSGKSLRQALSDGPLEPRRAAKLLRTIAEAIAYAHSRGIVHRDLKPSNILLDDAGRPRVTDFGLAKQSARDEGLTQSGNILGTPGYMPPEQAGSDEASVGERSDVYSLGATLYHLLTGRPPFQSASVAETILQVLNQEPVPPRRLNASIPRDLETICLKCLEKEPTRRYLNAQVFAEDLQRFVDGEPVAARPVGSIERIWRWSRRRPVAAALVATIAISLVAVTTASTIGYRETLHALRVAENATEEAVRSNYGINVAAAQAALDGENARQARIALDACPEDLRHIEWRILDAISDRSTRVRQFEHFDAAALHPDLDLVCVADDRVAQVWHMDGAEPLAEIPLQTEPLGLTFSPDGALLCGASYDGNLVWDWRKRSEPVAALPSPLATQYGNCLAFAPDGQRLAARGGHNAISIWEIGSWDAPLSTSEIGRDAIGLAYVRDGSRLMSVDDLGGVLCIDLSDRNRIYSLRRNDSRFVSVMAASSDGALVAVARMIDSSIEIRTANLFDDDGEAVNHGELIALLTGHRGRVEALAFAPNGKLLASAGEDAAIRLWNLQATPPTCETLLGHQATVRGLAFSDDGEKLMSYGADDAVRSWNLDSPPVVRTLVEGRQRDAYADPVAVEPSGKRMIHAMEATVAIRDVAAPETPVESIEGHGGPLDRLKISDDGRSIVTFDANGFVRKWNADQPDELPRLIFQGRIVLNLDTNSDAGCIAFVESFGYINGQRPNGVQLWKEARISGSTVHMIEALDVSADGSRIVGLGDQGDLYLWDTGNESTPAPVLTIPSALVSADRKASDSVTISADGNRFASIDGSVVKVWDFALPERPIWTHSAPFGGVVECIAMSDDGQRVLTTDADGDLRLWKEGEPADPWAMLSDPRDKLRKGVLSADGRWAAAIAGERDVRVWDLDSLPKRPRTLSHPVPILSVSISGDGRRVAAGADDGRFFLWNLDSENSSPIEMHDASNVRAIAISDDGHRLITAGGRTLEIRTLGSSNADPTILRGHPAPLQSVAIAKDAGAVVSADADGHIKVWDALGRETRSFRGFGCPVTSVAISPDGRRAVSKCRDGIQLWNVADGDPMPVTILPNPSPFAEPSVGAVALHPDGTRFASADPDGAVRIRDVESGDVAMMLSGHGSSVSSVAYSRDGSRLFTGDDDGTVKVWDANHEGEALLTLSVHSRPIAFLSLSDDGESLFAADVEGKVVTWSGKPRPAVDREPSRTRVRTGNHALRVIHRGWGLAWSGDGSACAYQESENVRGVRTSGDLVILDWPSGARRTTIEKGLFPAWSSRPDGPLAYTRPGESHFELWIVDSLDQPGRKLADGLYPHWSQDGAILYFVDSQTFMLKSIAPEIGPDSVKDIRQLESGVVAAVSPDGRLLALPAPRGERNDESMFEVREVGSDKTIASYPTPTWYSVIPGWSPDSRHVGFGRTDGLYVMNVESGEAVKVANGMCTMPRWTPDGKYIAFDDRSKAEIRVVESANLRMP